MIYFLYTYPLCELSAAVLVNHVEQGPDLLLLDAGPVLGRLALLPSRILYLL